MTHYQKKIEAILGVDVDARQVEAYMRVACDGTLDGLSPLQFSTAAREAAECVKLNPVQAEALAKSYGL